MGEIKSTLDIIMEKTQNLTLTEEEKKDLRRMELAEKVKGWVLQYIDNRINQEIFKAELKKEGENDGAMLQELLKIELVESLRMDDGNEKVLDLMKDILNMNKDPFVNIIRDFQREVSVEKSKRLGKIKKMLTERSIFGSAVIPNLTLDESWDAYYTELESVYKKRLHSITDN